MKRLVHRVEQLKHDLNIYRRYSHWTNKGIIFIHVPKAAGTSINNALYGRTLGHYTAEEIRSTFPRLFDRSFVFSFVRNPWDRVLSAYRFVKKERTESMGMAHPERYRIPAFSSFERFLFDWLVYQDFGDVDFVFQRQSRFVCDPAEADKVIVDYLGKVETMASDMTRLSEIFGRRLEVPESNITSRAGWDFRNEYKTAEMVDIVEKLYKRDVRLFDYTFE